MKFPNYMTQEEAKQIENDVVSDELRVHLTRMLRSLTIDDESYIQLIKQNDLVNRSRTIAGRTIYVLKADEDGHYYPQENAWHNGEMELVIRRLSTPELAEYLAELVRDKHLDVEQINDLLEMDGVSFRLCISDSFERTVSVDVLSIEDLEKLAPDSNANTHPNIRLLVHRMEKLLADQDYPGVLHASASIFETLAKIVVALATCENQPLGTFFSRYRNDSRLPDELLDYIESVYKDRNTEPLAGHGSTTPPSVDKNAAIVLSEMTKAFVQIEYKLSIESEDLN